MSEENSNSFQNANRWEFRKKREIRDLFFYWNTFGRAFPDAQSQKENNMKNRTIRIVLLMAMLLAAGTISAQADTSPVPLCYPRPCPVG
jgi:hypothetical protein